MDREKPGRLLKTVLPRRSAIGTTAAELKLQEQAGKPNARLNSQEARRRADELQARLQRRMEQLDLESQIAALPPVVLGGLVVVPWDCSGS